MRKYKFTLWRWSTTIILNLEDTSPLGEIATVLLVLSTSVTETIQTLGSSFVHATG